MTFKRVAADDADTPCMLVSATVTWVVKIPDGVADETDDLHAEVDRMEKEFTDELIREMRLDTDDGIADYDVDVSTLLVHKDGGDADGE